METAVLPAPGEQKLSRYRSVRKAAQKQQQTQTTDLPAMPQASDGAQKDTVTRSMSRYHRARPTAAPPSLQAQPPVSQRAFADPQQHAPKQDARPSRTSMEALARAQQDQVPRHKPLQLQETVAPCPQARNANAARRTSREQPISPRDEARQLLANEAERHRRMHEKLRAEKMARQEAKEAEAARHQEQQELDKRKAQRAVDEANCRSADKEEDRLRRHSEQEHADRKARAQRIQREERSRTEESTKTPHISGMTSPTKPNVLKESLSFLKRRRSDEAPKSCDILAEPSARRSQEEGQHATIKPGGGGAVPGTDAPVSAVNAGDRSVMVEHDGSQIILPVTPTTTVLDLIRSASTRLSGRIDPQSSVLLELFGKVGVQRPLRHYEHARDVMNSWDEDRQHTLILVESAGPETDKDLKATSVTQERPEESSYTLYYSQKPGKWDKRWITLRSDGQIVSAKNENSKETTNVCHLSDFDIYTPTARQKAKKIKPPKKICFAIKSQQKSNMFMSTNMFVHFFCTNDKQIGEEFYRAVQGWRSWYLVNIMGEGRRKSKLAETAFANPDTTVGALNGGLLATHRPNASIDSHYQLGSFKPLLDMSQFNSLEQPRSSLSHETGGVDGNKATLIRNMSLRTKTSPPISSARQPDGIATGYPHRPSVGGSTQSQPISDNGTFAPTSLLGRTYSQRQRVQREREAAVKNAGPFTEGPSLLNNLETPYVTHASVDSGPQRMASMRSTRNTARDSLDLKHTTSIKRNTSIRREKPKPLVDLTPQYREPPQFAKKGRGFHPEQVGPGGLIESATSPEVAIAIPPAVDWRGRNGVAAANASAGVQARMPADARPSTSSGSTQSGGQMERTRSHEINRTTSVRRNRYDNVPEDSQDAFTGRGLLARTGPSQGGKGEGHGVMSGANAKGPMIDVREESRFASGSLLRRVETEEGVAGPVIDRSRRSLDHGSG